MRLRTLSRFSIAMLLIAMAVSTTFSQTTATPPPQKTERPSPPTRDPHSVGYVVAKELPDGEVPAANADGNFIIRAYTPGCC